MILNVLDDFGARQGTVADGATTDDATPTFNISLPDLPPLPSGSPGHPVPGSGSAIQWGEVRLIENGAVVGTGAVAYYDGVAVNVSGLAPGEHTLTAVAVDRAGNQSAPSAEFTLTIGPDQAAGQVVQAGYSGGPLAGGTGDDTLVSGHGRDRMTGGEGADVFVVSVEQIDLGGDNAAFRKTGWDDVITDFNFEEGDRLKILGVDNWAALAQHVSLTPTESGWALNLDRDLLLLIQTASTPNEGWLAF